MLLLARSARSAATIGTFYTSFGGLTGQSSLISAWFRTSTTKILLLKFDSFWTVKKWFQICFPWKIARAWHRAARRWRVLYGSANDPRTANDPGPQMIPDRKWSPNWTANDPGPEMIPILDRKWSRSKDKEWHGFISEEGENMCKNYELKNKFYHFTKKYSTVAVLFFEHYRSFSLSRNKKKVINRKPANGKS